MWAKAMTHRLGIRECIPAVRTLTRLTASNGAHTWVYQFHPTLWQDVAGKITRDATDGKIPYRAAQGLIQLLAEGIEDES